VVALADKVASTSGMIEWCRRTPAKTILVGTEIGLLHRLRKDSPEKTFLPVSPLADCPNMKLNTLEKMVWALEDMEYRVTVAPEVAGPARRAIQRMLEIA